MDSQDDDTLELMSKITSALMQGATISAAAAAAGIHRSTLYRWLHTDEIFRGTVTEILNDQCDVVDDQFTEIARASVSIIRDFLQKNDTDPAARVRTALAVLSRSPNRLWRSRMPAVPQPAPEHDEPQTDEEIANQLHFLIPRPWAKKPH